MSRNVLKTGVRSHREVLRVLRFLRVQDVRLHGDSEGPL